jgi:methionyl aminopeptidase
MRQAGQIVAEVFRALSQAVRPGASTADLNAVVESVIRSYDAKPLFKGYRGFPASSCISLNEEVVHGIPSRRRRLEPGTIVSVDVGVKHCGYCGDAAVTFPVGKVSEAADRLLSTCREALRRGVDAARPGNRLSDIGGAIQAFAEAQGYGVVRRFVGHGIGTDMHEAPQVPNYVDDEILSKDVLLKPGMVLAIEPMLTEGTHEVEDLDDGWTVVTADRRLSAHYEHTVALGPEGPQVLTPWHELIDSEVFSGKIVQFADREPTQSHAERRADSG